MGESGSDRNDEDDWDNWRLRLADYGIGVLIALVLTPLLVFGVLFGVSDAFRDFVLR